MALAFSEKITLSAGDKAFRVYEVTHDGISTTIQANDLNLTYIEHITPSPRTALSTAADDFPGISGTTTGLYVTIRACSADAVTALKAWGW
jgi:hypothetical protein